MMANESQGFKYRTCVSICFMDPHLRNAITVPAEAGKSRYKGACLIRRIEILRQPLGSMASAICDRLWSVIGRQPDSLELTNPPCAYIQLQINNYHHVRQSKLLSAHDSGIPTPLLLSNCAQWNTFGRRLGKLSRPSCAPQAFFLTTEGSPSTRETSRVEGSFWPN
jgi:hypothetical protein